MFVLLVDDDIDSRDAVAGFLIKAGHHVAVAPNGRDALAALSGRTPDVVVLDYRMPEMDGISFLEVIRCYLRWRTLPVILLTAYSEGLHLKHAVDLGVRKTIVKSDCDLQDLVRDIEACADDRSPPPTGSQIAGAPQLN